MTQTKISKEWRLEIDAFEIDEAKQDERGWHVAIRPTRKTTNCPCCGQASDRVHSYYTRRIHDLPVASQPVQMIIRARRFECLNEQCQRKIFCERLGHFAQVYSRMSDRLVAAVRAIGFSLNGEGGARLAKKLGIRVSGDTIIATVRRTPQGEVTAPAVMGVDDWAFRKGQRYGTLIIDHERGVPVDLIEGRAASDLTNWLGQHPGSRIVTRDRSTDFTHALTQASPDTLQVADRWHLLKNMQEIVKQILVHRRGEIEQTWKSDARLPEATHQTPLKIPASMAMPLPRGTQEQIASRASREHRKARFDQVKLMREQGLAISQISRVLDMNRKTARLYYYADVFPERKKNKCIKTSIDPYVDYLQQRFDEGCRNVKQLLREIQTRGYTGSYSPVRRWMWLRREAPAPTTPKYLLEGIRQQLDAAVRQITDLPSSRKLSWLLVCEPKNLTVTDRESLEVVVRNDIIRRVYGLAQGFGRMIRAHEHEQLDEWLEACASSRVSEMITFAKGIQSDYAAVKAALTTKWSNGPTEGHVNRLKTIKRLMFGRAKFDLLRIRVLHPT